MFSEKIVDAPDLSAAQVQSLTRIWQRTIGGQHEVSPTWESDLRHVYDLGLGLQELLMYLYASQPALAEFIQWANRHSPIHLANSTVIDDVLTERDIDHWNEHGYIVLKDAVSKEECIVPGRPYGNFLEQTLQIPTVGTSHIRQRMALWSFSHSMRR